MSTTLEEIEENTSQQFPSDLSSGDTFNLTEELGKGEITPAEYIRRRGQIVKPGNVFESFIIPTLVLFFEGIRTRILFWRKGHVAKQ